MGTFQTIRSRCTGTILAGLVAWLFCAALSAPPVSADQIGPPVLESRPQVSKDALPLGRPRDAKSPVSSASPSTPLTDPGNLTTLGSLVLVLALIGATAWVVKRASRNGTLMSSLGAGGRAPSGILEVLGRYPLARGSTLIMLKVDRRILLISQTTKGKWGGAMGGESALQTLSEITDPEDVASILMKVQDDESRAANERFQGLLGLADREQTRLQRAAERQGGVIDVVDLRRAPLAERRPSRPAQRPAAGRQVVA